MTANFSEAINASTVTSATFQLRDAGNNLISATVATTSNQITLTPTAALSASTTYTVTIVGGASGVKDLAGNALVNNYTWGFTTARQRWWWHTHTRYSKAAVHQLFLVLMTDRELNWVCDSGPPRTDLLMASVIIKDQEQPVHISEVYGTIREPG